MWKAWVPTQPVPPRGGHVESLGTYTAGTTPTQPVPPRSGGGEPTQPVPPRGGQVEVSLHSQYHHVVVRWKLSLWGKIQRRCWEASAEPSWQSIAWGASGRSEEWYLLQHLADLAAQHQLEGHLNQVHHRHALRSFRHAWRHFHSCTTPPSHCLIKIICEKPATAPCRSLDEAEHNWTYWYQQPSLFYFIIFY